jgi:hypothetical protein
MDELHFAETQWSAEAMRRPFMDLGLDSLDAVHLVEKLKERLSFTVPSTVVFEHPSPLALARHLYARMSEQSAPPAASLVAEGRAAGADVMAEYQMWPHGYVALATLCASRAVLRVLRAGARTVDELADMLRANRGHLGVAMRTLRALGWIHEEEGAAVSIDEHVLAASEDELLHRLCVDVYADSDSKLETLAPWLRAAAGRWTELSSDTTLPPLLRALLTGAVLTPVLLELRARSKSSSNGCVDLCGMRPQAQAAAHALLASKGLVVVPLLGERLVLSELGKFVLERCGTFREAVSYRPMLRQLETVLFGDVATVFMHDGDGHELHVDRTMNVLASGFMHQRYFTDMARVHVRGTFDELPLAGQPAYIVDMGCGDGRLLRTLYEYIHDHTARGRALDEHPLTMVGIDFNIKSLESTARRLTESGVPHAVELGDIGDPGTMQATLERRFGAGRDAFLHVRSFLDHDRPFIPPVQQWSAAEDGLLNSSSDGVYVDHAGDLITPALAFRSAVEHLQRWSSILGRHGLLLLEVHLLDVASTNSHVRHLISILRTLGRRPLCCLACLCVCDAHP